MFSFMYTHIHGRQSEDKYSHVTNNVTYIKYVYEHIIKNNQQVAVTGGKKVTCAN